MPDPFTHPPPDGRRRCRSTALALAAGLGALVACADHVVAPETDPADLVTTPVQSIAVSDVVERVAGTLTVGVHVTQLNARVARLREQMESGRLQGAASTLVLAREALRAARTTDDGAMAADLTVIELALEDAADALGAAASLNQRKPGQ